MGGAYGHARHLWEDADLTFGDLKSLLHRIASADLEDVIEKTDGQNLFVTHDGTQLRAARNKSDLKNGGMTAQELMAKFAGRGPVSDAFTKGFETVEAAVRSLSPDVRRTAFGAGDIWHSIEVIYSANTNVINYGIDAIAFHRFAERIYDGDGEPVNDPRAERAFAALMANIETMRRAAAEREWKMFAPTVGKLEALTDKSHLERAISAVEFAQDMSMSTDDDTIGDHISAVVEEHVDAHVHGLTAPMLSAIAQRLAHATGPTMTELRTKLNEPGKQGLKRAAETIGPVIERAVQPIERAVTGLAIELLRGLDSVFVLDNTGEVARLRSELQTAVTAIRDSGNREAQDIVAKQLARLMHGIDDVGTAAEGIMFRDPKSGKVYKLTGAFASVNAILGLFKYGRGKIPPIKKTQAEHAVRSLIRRAIMVG